MSESPAPDAANAPPPADAAPPRRRRSAWRTFRRLLGTAGALLLALPVVLVWTPLGEALGRRLIVRDELVRSDYIVVLGGDSSRAVEAAQLYRQGWAPKVIVTSTGYAADHLAECAKLYGVPDDDIVRERLSTRTLDHPPRIAALEGVGRETSRLIVVTSPHHTSRSKALFERDGFAHVRMHSPDWERAGRCAPMRRHWTARLAEVPSMLYESAAWGYYSLRGWL